MAGSIEAPAELDMKGNTWQQIGSRFVIAAMCLALRNVIPAIMVAER